MEIQIEIDDEVGATVLEEKKVVEAWTTEEDQEALSAAGHVTQCLADQDQAMYEIGEGGTDHQTTFIPTDERQTLTKLTVDGDATLTGNDGQKAMTTDTIDLLLITNDITSDPQAPIGLTTAETGTNHHHRINVNVNVNMNMNNNDDDTMTANRHRAIVGLTGTLTKSLRQINFMLCLSVLGYVTTGAD